MGKLSKSRFSFLDGLTGWKAYALYLLIYTAVFVVLQHFVFLNITEMGMSFVWSTDGSDQHFARLLYISDNFRDLWDGLWAGKGIVWPMYDFRTGFVAHDLQVGLPHLLAIFFNEDNMDLFYTILVIGNYYMAGIAFSICGFYFKQKPLPALMGSFAYIFSGYAIYSGVRHPHFIVPLIILPLIILATERALRGERSILLSVLVFMSLVSQWGLYFSCLQALFVVLYAFARLIFMGKEVPVRDRFKKLLNLALWGFLGVLLAGVVLLPSMISMTGNGRVRPDAVSQLDMWRYNEKYLRYFLINYSVNHTYHSMWMFMSYTVLIIPGLLMFFTDRNKKIRHLKALWIVLTIMHLIPLFGFVFSGFSNITNRFCFGYMFLNIMITVYELPRIKELGKIRAGIVIGGTLLYCTASYFARAEDETNIIPYIFIAGTLAVITVIWFIFHKMDKARDIIMSVFCIAVTCVSVAYTASLIYNKSYLSQFFSGGMDSIRSEYLYSASLTDTVKNDDSFFRIDGNAVPYKGSASGFHFGLNTLTGYPYFGWSKEYEDWIVEMELARQHNKHRFLGVNARAEMLSLSSIKYFVDRRTDFSVRPYGFKDDETVQRDTYTDVLMENEYALPIGYTYDTYMLRSDYDKLWALDKQTAQTQAVIIEDEPAKTELKKVNEIPATAVKVDSQIVGMPGIRLEGKKHIMDNKSAMMLVSFEGLPHTNTYVRIKNMVFDYVKNNYILLNVSSGSSTTVCTYTDSGYTYYTGQDTMLLDLGYTDEGFNRVAITFDTLGSFTVDDIEIWCDPMTGYGERMDALKEVVLEDPQFGNRSLTGTVTTDKDRFLVVTIPYMDGWTCYLDGSEAKLYKANTAFMGLEIPKGTHTVEFRYWLPGFTPGIITSAAGVVLFAATVVIWNRKTRKGKKEEGKTNEQINL